MKDKVPDLPWRIVIALTMVLLIACPALIPAQGQAVSSRVIAPDSALAGLHYRVTTAIEGIAPAALMTRIMVFNGGDRSVHIEAGACPINVHAFRSREKREIPVWRSERRESPGMPGLSNVCISALITNELVPGDSLPFGLVVPTYEILGDSLLQGQYFLSALFGFNGRTIDLDAGSVVIPKAQKPPPTSRTIDSIQYSTRLHRTRGRSSEFDSLTLSVNLTNHSHSTHLLEPSPGCAWVYGYESRKERDVWYMRRPVDWATSQCALHIPENSLRPGQSMTFTNQVLAPPRKMFYMVYFWMIDDGGRNRPLTVRVDLGADEKFK